MSNPASEVTSSFLGHSSSAKTASAREASTLAQIARRHAHLTLTGGAETFSDAEKVGRLHRARGPGSRTQSLFKRTVSGHLAMVAMI